MGSEKSISWRKMLNTHCYFYYWLRISLWERKSQGSSIHRTHQVISDRGGNDLDNRARQHVGPPLHAWKGQEMNRKKMKEKMEKETERTERRRGIETQARWRGHSISTSFDLFDSGLSMIIKLEETTLNNRWGQSKVAQICQFLNVKLINS